MRVTRRSRSESLDRQEVLFSDIRLGEVLHERQQEALGEIAQYSADRLLNTSTDDLIAYFEKKHLPDPIRILEDEIRADYEEAKLERGGRSLYMSGTVIVLHVPFQGDPSLFRCVPSASNLSRPRGYITGNVLELLEYPANQDAQAVRQELDRRLEQIRKYVTWVASDLERFEQSLRDDARRQIEARRRKLLEAQGLAAAAGFPLRKRPDAPRTYVPSQLRRKLPPTPPPASTAPYVAEPTLEMERYEHILDIISKTASMLERSPQAFKGMNEE